MAMTIPNFLTHYYEAKIGPFVNLSDLPMMEAEYVLAQIRKTKRSFASQRASDYLKVRRELEDRVRDLFIQKGGKPERQRPHYMILGACDWVKTWYDEGAAVKIPLAAFSPEIVSFTYGDTFPAMRYQDSKPYRGQVYTRKELSNLVGTFGLPQVCNGHGAFGPDRYIEAQIWSDSPLKHYLARHQCDDI